MASETLPPGAHADKYAEYVLKIQQAVAPNIELPKLLFKETPVRFPYIPPRHYQRFMLLYEGAALAGDMVVGSNPSEQTRWIDYLYIDRFLKNQTVNVAAYLHVIGDALAHDYSVRTNILPETGDAKVVWDQLAAAGVARVVRGFEPHGSEMFIGHSVVDHLQVATLQQDFSRSPA